MGREERDNAGRDNQVKPRERREYRGTEGVSQALDDAENKRQEIVGYLETDRSNDWIRRFEGRYGKPMRMMSLTVLSYELVKVAANEDDVLLIRNLFEFTEDVEFNGDLTSHLNHEDIVMWSVIRRETRGFVKGYDLIRSRLHLE